MRKLSSNISRIILTFLVTLVSTGAHAKEISYGSIENDIYVNDYFNMSIPVPEEWVVQSQATLDMISKAGGDLIAGDDENLRAVLTEAEKQVVNLFAFFKHEVGAPVDFNPNIISVGERVSHLPGIQHGSDYLFHVQKLLKMGNLGYEFPADIYTVELSNVPFGVLEAQLPLGGGIVYQRYYATPVSEYILGFVLTYVNDSQLDELTEILEAVSFEKI